MKINGKKSKRKKRFVKKILAVFLVANFLFLHTDCHAEVSPPRGNLAAESRIACPAFQEIWKAAAICRAIEKSGSTDAAHGVKDVLDRLEDLKGSFTNIRFSILPGEVIIDVPAEKFAVRYIDPSVSNAITPYADIAELKTTVICPGRLHRQIIRRVPALEDRSDRSADSGPEDAATDSGMAEYQFLTNPEYRELLKKSIMSIVEEARRRNVKTVYAVGFSAKPAVLLFRLCWERFFPDEDVPHILFLETASQHGYRESEVKEEISATAGLDEAVAQPILLLDDMFWTGNTLEKTKNIFVNEFEAREVYTAALFDWDAEYDDIDHDRHSILPDMGGKKMRPELYFTTNNWHLVRGWLRDTEPSNIEGMAQKVPGLAETFERTEDQHRRVFEEMLPHDFSLLARELDRIEHFIETHIFEETDREIVKNFLADGETIVTASDGAQFKFRIKNVTIRGALGFRDITYHDIEVMEMAGDRPVLDVGHMIFYRHDEKTFLCAIDPLQRDAKPVAISVKERYRASYKGIGTTMVQLALFYASLSGAETFRMIDVSESSYLERIGFDSLKEYSVDSLHWPFLSRRFPAVEISAKSERNVPSQAKIARGMMEYVDGSETLLREMLGEGKEDVLLRVPVHAVLAVRPENRPALFGFLDAFQQAPNGFVEFFDMFPASREHELFADKLKPLPERLRNVKNRTRNNTVTLLPAFGAEKISAVDIHERLGDSQMDPGDTLIVPIAMGFEGANLVSSSIFGFSMLNIARSVEEPIGRIKVRNPAKHRDLMDRTQKALERYRSVSDLSEPFVFTDREVEEVLGLISGDRNCLIRALNRLIKLMPITPIDAEVLRSIFENARQVLLSV